MDISSKSTDVNINLLVLHVIISWSLWSSFYFLVRFQFNTQSPEWCSRVLSLLHGITTSIFGLKQCFSHPRPLGNPVIITSPTQRLILIFSLGYFIQDLLWCLYHHSETGLMIFHHTYSCVSLARMSYRKTGGSQACCILGGAEVSNPMLQLRWFLRSAGYKDTNLFVAVELTFMIIFVVVRIIGGTITLIIARTDTECYILNLIIYIISWLFLYNIYNYVKIKFMMPNVAIHTGETLPRGEEAYLVNADS